MQLRFHSTYSFIIFSTLTLLALTNCGRGQEQYASTCLAGGVCSDEGTTTTTTQSSTVSTANTFTCSVEAPASTKHGVDTTVTLKISGGQGPFYLPQNAGFPDFGAVLAATGRYYIPDSSSSYTVQRNVVVASRAGGYTVCQVSLIVTR